jgi:MGT family glycosyltransferase
MGRCVFFNLPGASGHINPTVGLVRELIARGEQVIYYAGEDSRAKFTRLGVEFRTYDEWFQYTHSASTAKNILDFALVEIDMALKCIEPLLERTREDNPDYLIYDSCCVWGKYIGEALHKPTIACITTLVSSPWVMLSDLPLSLHVTGVLIRGIPLITWARRQGIALMAKIGVEFRGILYHIFDFFACLGELNIVFNTREFQPFADRLKGRFHYVGASIPEGRDEGSLDLERFGNRPLIYVSMGTVHNHNADFYRTVMEALENEPVGVIMSIGYNIDARDLGRIPDNFIVEQFVPQLEVLKHADVFITHGGMNSLNEALYFGVPVIVVPQQIEQSFNMRRLKKIGVAQPMPKELTPQSIRDAVYCVLKDERYTNNARTYSEVLRKGGGHKAAAQHILDFIASRSDTTPFTMDSSRSVRSQGR